MNTRRNRYLRARAGILELVAIVAIASFFAAPAVYAFRAPLAESLHSRVVAPAGFNATVVPVELSKVLDEVPARTLAAVSAFEAEAGPHWRYYIDRRSGGMALVEGSGITWTEKNAKSISLAELEASARTLIQRYPSLFEVPEAQLVLDTRGSVQLGERGQYWNVAFRQVSGGIPVEGARVVFRIADGKLVQFGVDRTVPVGTPFKSTVGLLSPSQARNALARFVGGLVASDRVTEDGTLLWIPRGIDETGAYTGPIGGRLEARDRVPLHVPP
jgi:hypothetical protein